MIDNTASRNSQDHQLETVLADLKSEQAALADLVRSFERYMSLRGKGVGRGQAGPVQQPQLAGLTPKESATAIRGTISIRKAIAEVLRDAKRPMKAEEIWGFAYERGARTNSKRPAAIVALTCNGLDDVEKTAPRTYQWKSGT